MTEHNPGALLLQAVGLKLMAGMDREAAERAARAEFPNLALAHHHGVQFVTGDSLLPERTHYSQLRPDEQRRHLPPRGRRRVRADEMIEGRPYLHCCTDEAGGGGIFELTEAA